MAPAPEPVGPAVSAPVDRPPDGKAGADQPADKGPSLAVAAGKGLSVTSGDGRFSIGLRPRVQLRGTFTKLEDKPKDGQQEQLEFQVRTLRLWITGHALTPDLKYGIQLAFGGNDFDTGSSSPIFDAFIEYVGIRDFNVRVGQFFVPFDRARTVRESALQFVDRQQVVRELSLDRDLGIGFSSADLFGLGGRLAYNLFVGSGDGRNRFGDSKNPYGGAQKPGVLLVGRLTLRPFGPFDDDSEGDLQRSPKPRLAVGVAGAYNISSDRDKSTFGNTYTAGTFDYKHAAADLVLKWYGFSLLAEYLWREADHNSNKRVLTGTTATTEYSRSGAGYFVQAGQMLTSQLEVTARWDELFSKKGTDPALRRSTLEGLGRQVGGGLNLYLNGHSFKLQADYFYVFGDTLRATKVLAQHIARLQLDATF